MSRLGSSRKVQCSKKGATKRVYTRTQNLVNMSSFRSGYFDEKTKKIIFFEKNKATYFWQKNEGVILDDGNFVGPKSSLHPCCFSRKRMVSVSFISFEKYEQQMRNFFDIFSIFFAQKTSMEKLTSFLGQNAAYETLVQFTKPWTLYIVSVLRYRGSKMKNTQKSRYHKKNLLEKAPEAKLFRKYFFRRKYSRGFCATFSKNMVSIYILGFKKFASQV